MPQPGLVIGRGLTSEVFEYGPGRVVKVFFPWQTRAKVEREFEATRSVYAIGIPVPQALELTTVGDRDAIVFERIDGVSMFDAVQRKPWTVMRAARELAELHAALHRHTAPDGLPSQAEQLEEWLACPSALSQGDRASARRLTETMSAGNTLCHGDFHPGNVLCTDGGSVIIDWSTATSGDPVGDVARTSSLIRRAPIPEDTPAHMRVLVRGFRRLVHGAYLRRYFELRGGSPSEVAVWEPVQKAAIAAWVASQTGQDAESLRSGHRQKRAADERR